LEKALKKADALLYFSEGMAQDVKTVYPKQAAKSFFNLFAYYKQSGQRNDRCQVD
jgi:hypothetical protein